MTGGRATLARASLGRSQPSMPVVVWAALTLLACCGPPPARFAAGAPHRPGGLRELPARPPVAAVEREGDPRGALAVAVLTAGVDDASGARVPVALAAITESRLVAAGLGDATVAATWDGYRVRLLLPENGDTGSMVHAVRAALLSPVVATDPEMDAVAKKLGALARRPLADPALVEAARCADEPRSEGPLAPPPAAASVEQWRAASTGLGRVVFGVVGSAGAVDALTSTLLHDAAWPSATTPSPQPLTLLPSSPPRVYYGGPELLPGTARVTVLVRTSFPGRAIEAAESLGATAGPLALRIRALEANVTLASVNAIVQAGGGCLAVTAELPLEGAHAVEGFEGAVASTAAIVVEEANRAVSAARGDVAGIRTAALEDDPRRAAELAAWWGVTAPTWALIADRGERATNGIVIGIGTLPAPATAAGLSDGEDPTIALRRMTIGGRPSSASEASFGR